MIVVVPLFLLVAARQRAGWAEAVRFLSVIYQVRSFGIGQLDLRHLALHLSVCVLLLSLTVKVVAARGDR